MVLHKGKEVVVVVVVLMEARVKARIKSAKIQEKNEQQSTSLPGSLTATPSSGSSGAREEEFPFHNSKSHGSQEVTRVKSQSQDRPPLHLARVTD